MILQQPPADTEWLIEQSHRVMPIKSIHSDSLRELRYRTQLLADEVPAHARRKYPFGPLEYRYECDANDYVTVVHAYFKGVNGLRRRFLKLRRA